MPGFPDVFSCVCTTCLRVKLKINALPLDPLRERQKGRLSRLNKNAKAQSFVPVEQRCLNKDCCASLIALQTKASCTTAQPPA